MGTSRSIRSIVLGFGLVAPALASAQAPPPAPPVIDSYSGIFFFCKPLANEAWTARACAEVGDRMAVLAERAKKPIVLMKIGDTREKYPELAKAKGFDSNGAIWFLLMIDPHAQNKGQWEIAARADGISKPTSPGAQPQTVTYSKRATVISASAVAEKGAELLGGIMLVLTTPMRAL
jgi:hypothetical protein